MRTDANPATGTKIHEDALRNQLAIGSLGAVEIQRDPTGSPLRLERGVDAQASLERHRDQSLRELDVSLANARDADAGNDLAPRARNHVPRDRRRAVTETIHRGSVNDRCRLECE